MSSRGPSELDQAVAARLKRDPAGLVAAVVQQYDTGDRTCFDAGDLPVTAP